MIQRLVRLGWRQLSLFGTMCLFALLITQNLVHWQVAEHELLAQAAIQAYDPLVPDPAPRGSILDATGQLLVTNDMVYTLHVDPSVSSLATAKGRSAAVAKLRPILRIDGATLTGELTYRSSNPSAKYVFVADGLDAGAVNAIRKLNYPFTILEQHSRAHYLVKGLAAPLLGFVTKNGDGQYGIEEAYNTALHGRDGTRLNLATASLRPLPASVHPQSYVPGADIVLTINATIQQIAETRLKEELDRTHARGGTVIVMDPKTGAILAMASLPSFDPTDYSAVKDPNLFKNRTILHYQPGSTFKVFSVATGFDTNSFTPDTFVNDPGFYNNPAGPEVIHNWKVGTGWGDENPEIMLRHSANVGMAQFAEKIAQATSAQTFYNYIVGRFGFTQYTGIKLPGEEPGAVRQPVGGNWRHIDLLTNSYGQSIDVTPLQVVTAMAALANGGKRMKPYVVQKIVYPDGHADATRPKVVTQAVKPATAATITAVLNRSGRSQSSHDDDRWGNSEATCALTKDFPVAVKTGTATTEVSAYTTDTSKGTVASLLGFAPVDDPKFVMLVTVDHPQRLSTDNDNNSHIYGAITAGPVWHDIAERLYPLMNIKPEPNYPEPFPQDIPFYQGTQGWGCEFDKPNQG